MRGPKPQELTLSEKEQKELEALVRRHNAPQQQALRGRIILAAAGGKNNTQIARELHVSVDTVRTWRARWIALQALDGNAVIVETKDHRVFRNSSRARFRAASAMFVFLLFGGGRSSNHSGSPRTTALL